jgi:hypothetical protein
LRDAAIETISPFHRQEHLLWQFLSMSDGLSISITKQSSVKLYKFAVRLWYKVACSDLRYDSILLNYGWKGCGQLKLLRPGILRDAAIETISQYHRFTGKNTLLGNFCRWLMVYLFPSLNSRRSNYTSLLSIHFLA